MKSKQQKGFLYPALAAMLLVVLMQQSCKKTNSEMVESVNNTAGFFKMSATLPNAVRRVANELQQQNNNKAFVAQFLAQEGRPLWDKAISYANSKTNARSLSTGNPDTTVIIPIVLDKQDHVGAFFLATVKDTVSVRLFRNSDYKRFPYEDGTPKQSTSAEEFALRMMQMDREVFGYTRFELKDSLLFGGTTRPKPGTKISRKVDLGNTNGGSTSLMQMVCVTIETTETTQYCGTPWAARCQPNCDNCGYPTCYPITTTSTTTYCTQTNGGNSPSFPTFPTSGGGGGGGTTGGGGGNDCPLPVPFTSSVIPSSCQGQVPSPWPPYLYQLTPNDIRVINELNEEDNETENTLSNSDCQGTKRSGNIYRYGTKEHWLIELDYVCRNPVYGEMEYAIPQSSAAGNRGYADIVNKQSNEIFEIKPNNDDGKRIGAIEVDRYVEKAKIYCPTAVGSFPPAWHPGTDYATRYLPSTDPNKFLVAEKMASGVIGYKYEDKLNTPNPAPITIPSSIIDKLKELVERLKNNVNDFDRIISEYMSQHPELVTYIKSAAVGAAVGIVVGTIIEDFATAGSGILDDWTSFTLAYRIVRFAWKL